MDVIDRVFEARLAQLLRVPLQVVQDQLKQHRQLALDRLEQTEIQRTVFDDVNVRVILRDRAVEPVDHVVEHTGDIVPVAKRDRDVLPPVREHGAQRLRQQQANGEADVLLHVREANAQDRLVFVAALEHAAHFVRTEVDDSGRLQIVVAAHLQIAGGADAEAAADLGQLDVNNLARRDDRVRSRRRKMIGAQLAVVFARIIQVRRAVQHHAHLRRHTLDLIVLALVGHELPRQHTLRDVAEELRVHILGGFFVLNNVVRIFQRARKILIERLLGDRKTVFRARVVPGIVADEVFHRQHTVVCIGVLADQLGQRCKHVISLDADQRKLRADLLLGERAVRHRDDQLDDRVALALDVIRHKRRHCVGVGHEQLPVAAHIVAQQIVLGEHVHKDLPGSAREIQAHGGKHIAKLVLDNQKLLLLGRRAPEVRHERQLLVERLLLAGNVHIPAQRGIKLPVDPLDVPHGGLGLAEPRHARDLVTDCDRGQLRAVAEVAGLLVKDPLAAVITVRVPRHGGVGAARYRRRRDLDDLGAQQVRHRVDQTVGRPVADAVNGSAAILGDLVHDDVERDLRRVDDQRRLQEQYEVHPVEKLPVGFEHFEVVQLPERQDAHVNERRTLIQTAHAPERVHLAVLIQQFRDPRLHIAAHRGAGGDDEAFLVGDERIHERERDIVAHVPVKGREKQHALAVHQLRGGAHRVRVEHGRLPEREVRRRDPVDAVLRLRQGLEHIGHTLGAHKLAPHVRREQLRREKIRQRPLHAGKDGDARGTRRVCADRRLLLVARLATEKVANLIEHDLRRARKHIQPRAALRTQRPHEPQNHTGNDHAGYDAAQHELAEVEPSALEIPSAGAGIIEIIPLHQRSRPLGCVRRF